MGTLPATWSKRNWFSITKSLPGTVPASRHDGPMISELDKMWGPGSQDHRTGLNRRILAECGVGSPLVQAGCFLQASQLRTFEADREKDEDETDNVVSVVLTTFLPMTGQQNITR